MAKGSGQYILENRFGQAVRTFRWEQSSLNLVYRHDTRRIEPVSSLKELEGEGISFELLSEVKREQIKKKPLAIGKIGQLRWVEFEYLTAPNVELSEAERTNFWQILKWTSASYALFLLIVVGLGYVLRPEEPKEQVVKIINLPPPEVKSLTELEQKTVKPPVTVEASQTKPIAPTKQQVMPQSAQSKKVKDARAQVNQSNLKRTHSRAPVGGYVGPQWGDPSQAGVLGVLGSENRAGTGRGGFNVANARSTGGFGAGRGGGGYGGKGAGGIPRAIFSHGMIAANPGPGSGAPGAGGYGAAGFGGGGRKGFGKLGMSTATHAYFSPVEQEALVEGGLSRDAIAEVIQRNMGQITYCYEQGLQVKPSLAGRVTVRFVVGGAGRIASAKVASSSLRHAPVESCIVGKLKSWVFPRPTGGVNVRVTYPFALRRVSART